MIPDLIKYDLDFNDEDGFSLYERTLSANTRIPLHWHEFLEFEIIVSGSLEHNYNGETYVLRPGNAHLMCYYDLHELTALTDVKLYCIHFSKNMLDPEISQCLDFNKFHCMFDDAETLKMIHRIRELAEETDKRQPFRKQIIRNIITEIVIAMIRKSAQEEIHMAPLAVQKAIAYLNEHFLEKHSLTDLAETLAFSPNYLGRLFKTQIGCTYNDYLNTLRLKYACSLLLSSKMSVKEIALFSGYSSVEYFMYIFKKRMNITPIEYRKQMHVIEGS